MAILMWGHPYVLFWEHKKLSTIFKRVVQALSVSFLKKISIVRVKWTALAHDTSSLNNSSSMHAIHLRTWFCFKFLTKTCGKKDLKSVSSSVVPTGIFGELLMFSISGH